VNDARFESDGSDLFVIESHSAVFARQKAFAEHAFGQLDDAGFFRPPGNGLNSVAIIAQHIAGNLASRWTDFLTTDGEKEFRDRDAEFVLTDHTPEARAKLMADWERGWAVLLGTLASLTDNDLGKTVTIRAAPHTVALALARGLDHISFHVGQVNVIARLHVGSENWNWFTLPPGGTKAFNEQMRAKNQGL